MVLDRREIDAHKVLWKKFWQHLQKIRNMKLKTAHGGKTG